MSRRAARENLFKLIYERCVTGEKNALTFNLVYNATAEAQLEYFEAAYNGIDSKFDRLTGIVSDFAADFRAERIYKVDLSILILAVYEVLYCDSIPDVVAINEAVEIAKVYSTERSAAFINGILASIARSKADIILKEENAAQELIDSAEQNGVSIGDGGAETSGGEKLSGAKANDGAESVDGAEISDGGEDDDGEDN